MQAVNIYQNNK